MRVSPACILLGMLIVLPASGRTFSQDTNFASGPQYLLNGSALFAHSISTPTLSLRGPRLEAGASDASADLVAGAENQTPAPRPPSTPNLFPIYYGRPQSSVIEISFSEESFKPVPERILDSGVWQITSAQALSARGYGVTLAEAAARSKAQRRPAPRVFTNEDIERLHGGSKRKY